MMNKHRKPLRKFENVELVLTPAREETILLGLLSIFRFDFTTAVPSLLRPVSDS